MKNRRQIEHELQVGVINWVETRIALGQYVDELNTLHAIPNGGKRPHKTTVRNGKKYTWSPEGKRLKDEGVKSGIPDLHLPVSRGPYHSLYIEMKAPKGRLSTKQKDMILLLRQQGNYVIVCDTVFGATDFILRYLNSQRYEFVPRSDYGR